MRSRKEIEGDRISDLTRESKMDKLKLEVLLDIRDLITESKEEAN